MSTGTAPPVPRERGLTDAEVEAIGNDPTIADYYDDEIHWYVGMEAGDEPDSTA